MTKLTLATSSTLFLILTACSTESPKSAVPKKAEEPAKPVSGMTALYRMYQPARAWAPDIQVLTLKSLNVEGVAPERGKAGAWEATFVSPGKGRARGWTYSVVEGPGNLHKGPFAGMEEAWSGSRGQAKPFLIAAVKTDTDAAYQTALKKAAEYEKKNPNKPIQFLLEYTGRHPDPAWRVLWGESIGTSNFSVLVDATTGNYLETLR
ncbi:MAG: hypothetical protein ACE15B_11900 [Bryobacteraceae bacterium]